MTETSDDFKATLIISVNDLNCPLPLLKIKKAIYKIKSGDIIQINGIKSNFINYLQEWCERNKISFISEQRDTAQFALFLKKL